MTTEERIAWLEQTVTNISNAVDQLELRSHIHYPSEHHTVDWKEETLDVEPTEEYPHSGGWTQQKARNINVTSATNMLHAPNLQCKGEGQGETRNPLPDSDLHNRETLQDSPKTAQNDTQTEPTMQDYQRTIADLRLDYIAAKNLYYQKAAEADALTTELAKARQDCQRYREALEAIQAIAGSDRLHTATCTFETVEEATADILETCNHALQPTL